jgi:hypothetical protein
MRKRREAMSDIHYLGVPIADILKVAGLNRDLTTNMGDPRNVTYIGPLEPDDEDMAEEIAKAIYGAWREQHGGDDDMAFEQCLVDARRMLLDDAYASLFTHDTQMPPPEARPIDPPPASPLRPLPRRIFRVTTDKDPPPAA